MLNLLKKAYNNIFAKIILLLVLLLAIFMFSGGHFIFVKAYSDQVNVFPGTYELDQNDGKIFWQNIENSFFQDLSGQAAFDEFNSGNSAYIMYPSAGSDQAPGKDEDQQPASLPATTTAPDEPQGQGDAGDLSPNQNAEAEAPDDNPASDFENRETGTDQGTIGNDLAPAENQEPAADDNADYVIDPASTGSDDTTGNTESDGETSYIGKIFEAAFDYVKSLPFLKSKLAQAQDEETDTTLKQSLIFSDFSVPLESEENGIGETDLRLSLGARSASQDDQMTIEYFKDGGWRQLSAFSLGSPISNASQGDYFSIKVPDISSWDEINNLKFRVSYLNSDPSEFDRMSHSISPLEIYLDALWLEIRYDENPDLNETATDTGMVLGIEESLMGESDNLVEPGQSEAAKDYDLDLVSDKTAFRPDEKISMNFRYGRHKQGLNKLLSGFVNLFSDEYKNIKISAKLKYPHTGYNTDFHPQIRYINDGQFEIDAPETPRQFKPGINILEVTVEDDNQIYTATQEFVWGVLAVNTDKSVYTPGEEAYLQMAALDDEGHTLCDANMKLEITLPDGSLAQFNTASTDPESRITGSPTCGANNVTDEPDYYTYFKVGQPGVYEIKLSNLGNGYEITDSFQVEADVPFIIARSAATRINPFRSSYNVRIKVTALADFTGTLEETVPALFLLSDISGRGEANPADDHDQTVIWPVDLKAGVTVEFDYTYFAPKISPQFYLLGPAILKYDADNEIFREFRQWQLAADNIDVIQTDSTLADNDAATSISSHSLSLTEGDLLVVALAKGNGSDMSGLSISGFGLTYDLHYSGCRDTNQTCLAVWTAQITGPTPNPDTVDISWTTAAQAVMAVHELSGVEYAGLTSNNGQALPSAGSVDISTTEDYSMILGIFAKRGGEAITGDPDYYERESAYTTTGNLGNQASIQTQDRVLAATGSDTVDWNGTWTDGADWIAAAMELKDVGPPAVPTLHNIPFANEETPDTTPDFEFTTGTGGADLVYEISWSTDPDFTSSTTRNSVDNAGFFDTVNSDASPIAGLTSGHRVRFTVQAGDAFANSAADTAYYWRIRARTTSSQYSDWSETKALRVNTTLTRARWVETTDWQFDSGGSFTDTATSGLDSVMNYTSVTVASSSVFDTAGLNNFTVPDGVTSITVKAWGRAAAAAVPVLITPAAAAAAAAGMPREQLWFRPDSRLTSGSAAAAAAA